VPPSAFAQESARCVAFPAAASLGPCGAAVPLFPSVPASAHVGDGLQEFQALGLVPGQQFVGQLPGQHIIAPHAGQFPMTYGAFSLPWGMPSTTGSWDGRGRASSRGQGHSRRARSGSPRSLSRGGRRGRAGSASPRRVSEATMSVESTLGLEHSFRGMAVVAQKDHHVENPATRMVSQSSVLSRVSQLRDRWRVPAPPPTSVPRTRWLDRVPLVPDQQPRQSQKNAKRHCAVLMAESGLTASGESPGTALCIEPRDCAHAAEEPSQRGPLASAYSCLAGIRQRHNSVVEGLLPDELLRADISIQTHRGTLVRAMMLWVCGDVTEAQLIQLGLEDLVR